MSPGFSAAAAAVCQGFVCLFFGAGMAVNRAPIAGGLFLLAGACFAIMRSHISRRSLHAPFVRVLSSCAAGLIGAGIVVLSFTTDISAGHVLVLGAPAALQLFLAWCPERTENE